MIVRHLVAEARRHGADGGGARLHGQGERPSALRGGHPRPRPRPRDLRPGPSVGPHPRGLRRVAAKWDIPHHGDQGEAVLDRREPVGQGHRVRRDRGPVGAAARRRVHADPRHTATEPVEVVVGFEAGRPGHVWTARASRPTTLIAVLSRSRRASYGFGRLDMVENRRVGIKSREVYECPAALALILAHADLEDLTLERDLHHEKARLEPRWSELVYDGLWFSPLQAGARRVRHRDASATSPARCACALRAGHVHGRRTPQPARASTTTGWPPTTPSDTFRHAGRRGLRAAVGSGRRDLVGPPGPRDARGGRAAGRRAGHDAVGRTLSTGMADAVAASPSACPSTGGWPPTTWPAPAPTSGASAGGHPRPTARSPRCSPRSTWSRRSWPTGIFAFAPERRGHPHRRSSGGSPSSPATSGAKLHTGRSRNDQVATDLRL